MSFNGLRCQHWLTPILLTFTALPIAAAQTATTTVLSISTNTARLGQSVTLTASVTPNTVTGNVTFYDDIIPLGVATLVSGQANFKTVSLGFGDHSLHALYQGNAGFGKSSSVSIPLHVFTVGGAGFSFRTYDTPGNPSILAIADLNGDGKPDIVTAGHGGLAVLLGIGDGTFEPPQFYAIAVGTSCSGPNAIGIYDLNADGKLDMAVIDCGSNSLSVFLGNGDGTFGSPTNYKTGLHPTSLAICDLNNDGNADVAVANSGEKTISIFLGNGGGSFQNAINAVTVHNPSEIASLDTTRSGRADLVMTQADPFHQDTIGVLKGNGDGTFQPEVEYEVHSGAVVVWITPFDLNHDGIADIVTSGFEGSVSGTVSVLLGNSDGTFASGIGYAATREEAGNVTVSDFNGDGRADVGTPDWNASTFNILLGNGDGTLQPPLPYPVGAVQLPLGLSAGVADLNGDGIADVVIADPTHGEIDVLLGITAGTISLVQGSGQSTQVGTVFPVPLRVRVTNASGQPQPNAPVTLTAPASGASGTFANGRSATTIATDVNGYATAVLTANLTPGVYDVSAVLAGGPTVLFSLTNVAGVEHQPPTADSVAPSSGAGVNQTFTLQYSDPYGFETLNQVFAFINTHPTQGNGCNVYYRRSANKLYLENDAGTGWLGPLTPGGLGSVSNMQCSLHARGSSASGLARTLTLNAALTFKPAYAGMRSIYMYAIAADGLKSGWQGRGTWYTGQAVAPSAVSVTPKCGTGIRQTFSFKYSDVNGYSQLTQLFAMFNTNPYVANTCNLYYLQSKNVLYLHNDANTAWLGPLTPGTAGTVSNSQCTLDGSKSSVSGSGDTLTVNATLTFQPGFVGLKNVYMYAINAAGLKSGVQQRGTWNTGTH